MYLLGSKLRLARGVISAIDANRPRTCRGIPSDDSRICSDTVISVELQPVLNGLGLTVLKAPF